MAVSINARSRAKKSVKIILIILSFQNPVILIRNFIVLNLLYLLLIFIPFTALSQHVKYEIDRYMTFSVPFLPDPQSYNKNGNEILTEMAKEVLKDPWKVKIEIRYHLQFSIATDPSGKINFIITTSNPQVTGDIHYRLFNISDVLLPSRINYKVRIGNKADSSMFREKEFTNLTFGCSDTSVTGNGWFSFDQATDTITISSAVLSYDEEARNTFLTRLNQIDDYYACRWLLDTLDQLALKIDLKDKTRLPLNYLRIRELDHAIELIKNRNFTGKLRLNDSDPKNLIEKLDASYKYSRSLTFTFTDVLMKAGALDWPGNTDSLSDYFTSRVLEYISLSHKMSEINGSIYKDWLDNYFSFKAFENEPFLISLMSRKLFPDALQDTVLTYFSSEIYHAYQKLAKKLIGRNQFAQAYSLMEHASLFALSDPGFRKELMENEIISEASKGIYDSYIGIARTCLINQNYSMADDYLGKAVEYRNNHSGFIFSDSLYNVVFSDLFFKRNNECDKLLSDKKYDEALICYLFFEHSYDSLQITALHAGLEQKKSDARYGLFLDVARNTSETLSSGLSDSALFFFEKLKELENELPDNHQVRQKMDSLNPLIARIKYDRLLQAGSTAVSLRLFSSAVQSFSRAKVIAEEYRIPSGLTFDSLYRLSVRQNLLTGLSAHQRLIWLNQFDSAKAYLDKVSETISLFNLSKDSGLKNALNRFIAMIEDQKCHNLYDTLQLQLIRSDRSRALKNYSKSVSLLREALAIAENNRGCQFPLSAIRDSISKYYNPAIYQDRIGEAIRNMVSGQYQKTVSLLTENETFYQVNGLDRFGIPPVSLYEYTVSRGNPYLTENAIAYFYGRSDFREAMRYLHLLKLQGYSERNVSETQDQIGRRMANADLRQNSKADPVILVDSYTGKNPWFNTFRSSYLEEWNKLIRLMRPVR